MDWWVHLQQPVCTAPNAWQSTWFSLAQTYFDIFRDIQICKCFYVYTYNTFWHVYILTCVQIFQISCILSGTVSEIHSDMFKILSHTPRLHLTCILTRINDRTYIVNCFWQSIWHSIWHPVWHIFWRPASRTLILSETYSDKPSGILPSGSLT